MEQQNTSVPNLNIKIHNVAAKPSETSDSSRLKKLPNKVVSL